MPNLVVYVPAGLWKELEETCGEDAKNQAREVASLAIRNYVKEVALVERGASENEPVPVTVEPASAGRGAESAYGIAGPEATTRPRSTSACSSYAPAGTKCKVCGKVHPR